MNHYLYLLEFSDGKKYVGARSTKLKPQLDTCYLGSGKALPTDRSNCNKIILATYSSREELIRAEIQFIINNNCVKSDTYYNLRTSTFDKHGMGCTNTDFLKGKTKENTEYIRKANIVRRSYTGNNRTPAQKAHDESMRGVSTGPNAAKGNPGISNPAFIPWYYITPNGDYHEVFDKTKQEFAKSIGATVRQINHRFIKENEHKQVHRTRGAKPLRGYTFGNLPRPTNTGTD